jgi:ribosomal protein S18 acetylase RimI-like enzyme
LYTFGKLMPIEYRHDRIPSVAEIVRLYDAAPLFRPTKDTDRIRRMYEGSNVVWTAWDTAEAGNARLVGILRGWTDGAYDGYVCDLAVDPGCQNQGIGRELLARVTEHYGPQVQWVLRASKIAAQYYEHLGWKAIENGWSWARESWK